MNQNANGPGIKTLAAVFLILLAGITVYANTLHVPFILDDHLWITLNPDIKELDNYLGSVSGYNSLPGRYISVLTLALNYHFGKLDVTGYHLVNLGIHLITGMLVYALLRLTFRTPYFLQKDLTPPALFPPSQSSGLSPRAFIPLFAALLFVIHPVQTEAVTYIVQRTTSLATLFYLLSIVLFARARLSIDKTGVRNKELENRIQTVKFGKRMKGGLLIAGSVLSSILAMRTKEISFTLPFVIVLYELFFFRGPWKKRLLYLLPILATLPIIPLTVIGSALDTGGAGQDIITNVSNNLRVGGAISRLDYLFTQFRVIVTYLRLLVLPVNQNLDYDYPVYSTFFTPPVLLSFLLLGGILGLAVYLFRRTRWTNQNTVGGDTDSMRSGEKFFSPQPRSESESFPQSFFRLVSFGILWFFLTISVESSIIPIQDVIAEHRLYLPAVGAAAVFATFFYMLGRKLIPTAKSYPLVLGAAALVLILGFATYQRNHVWGNEIRLWQDVVDKSPDKARPYSNLGSALNDADRPWDAIPVIKKALAIAPYFDRANFNLARSYFMISQYAAAIPFLQRAISANPDFIGAYSDLSAAFIKTGRYREAVTFLEQNLGRLGKLPEARFNLGVAYLNTGQTAAAWQQVKALSGLDPALAARLANFLQRR